MSRRHDNVSCDSCFRGNFSGKRYKCLVCSDYDLCEGCREKRDSRHSPSHPMQCLLTPAELAIHFPGMEDASPALTCPVCGALGHTELTLQAHLTTSHPDQANREIMCPACALLPIRESSMLTGDLSNHLLLEHAHRESISLSSEVGELRRGGSGGSRAADPIGEMLSTLSRRGLQRQYRPPSVYSLLRPLSASSSGLSLRRPPQPPVGDLPLTGLADKRSLLLDACARLPRPEAELRRLDRFRAARSLFTQQLFYSSLCLPRDPQLILD